MTQMKSTATTAWIHLQDLPKQGKHCIYSEFFYGLCIGVWSIVMNFHLNLCGISESHTGALLSAGYLITALVSLLVGRVGDVRGFPFVMSRGMALMCAALLLSASASTPPLLCIGHFLYCAGLACAMSMEFNLPLSLVRVDQQQYCYNLVLIMYFLGSIVGSLLCSLIFSVISGTLVYRALMLLCSALYACLAVFRGKMPKVPRKEKRLSPLRCPQKQSASPATSRYLIYGFLAFGNFTLATGMLNLVLREWRKMPDDLVSEVFALNSVVGCLILLLMPLLLCHFSRHSIACAALLLQSAAFFLMPRASTSLFIVLLIARTATCNTLYTGVDSPMLQSVPAETRGIYAGRRVFANYAGMSAMSLLSGWFISRDLFAEMYFACAALAVLQTLVYYFFCYPQFKSE